MKPYDAPTLVLREPIRKIVADNVSGPAPEPIP